MKQRAKSKELLGETTPQKLFGIFPETDKRGLGPALVSAFLHILLIWVLVAVTAVVAAPEKTQALVAFFMPEKTVGGGGGGAGGVVAVHTPPPPPPDQPKPVVVTPPPVPVVVPDVIPPVTAPVVEPTTAATASTSGVASSGSGGGVGGGVGTGDGPGTGAGKGPGSGGVVGNTAPPKKGTLPESYQMIIPRVDNVPKEYRGIQVEVTFYVEATGIVSKVTTNPVLTNKSYRKAFEESMMQYRWKPATDSTGKKIAMPAPITFTLGGG